MKLNFDFPINNLEGKEVANAGKLLGQVISAENKGNAIKLWDWSLKFYRGEDLELDNTDTDVLEAMVTNMESLTVLAKAQILGYIKKQKPVEKALKKA